MRLWVLTTLVAAGCGIGSYDEFRAQLAARWCARQIRCGEVGGSDAPSLCGVPAPLLLTVRGAVDVPVAIASHRMMFHPDNAAECLDAVKSAPCDATQAAADFYRHCHGVVTGAVANGGTCWGDDECLGGVCVAPDCGGTCTPYASPGDACVPTGGTPAMTCDPSVHYCAADGTCQHLGQKGAACAGDGECIFDYACVAGKCSDPPRLHPGDVCGTNLPPCADGQYCDETGVCAPLLAAGEPCVRLDACKPGLACAGGTCATWLDAGAMCDANAVNTGTATGCPATETCTDGACVTGGNPKVGPAASCGQDVDCADGLYCRTEGGYCDYVGGVNSPCQRDGECAKDLQCVSGACHTPGYIMCASM